MRRFGSWPRLALVLALVLAFGVMNGGCVLIPEIKDRDVELALSGSTTAPFAVITNGAIVSWDQPVTLNAEFNLRTILDDARIDASKVTGIAVSGISYSITREDPEPSREISGSTITVRRDAGPDQPLVAAFTVSPGAASGFRNVPLNANGVGVLNQALDDVLQGLQGPAPAPDVNLTFHLAGVNASANGSANTNFELTLKVTVSIKGLIQVSVPT